MRKYQICGNDWIFLESVDDRSLVNEGGLAEQFIGQHLLHPHQAPQLSYLTHHLLWLPYLIGGIIGALLLFFIFDWALIVVSSLAGASLIIQTLSLNPRLELDLYLALVIIGVVIQTALFSKSPALREPKGKS